jgi:putative transposase
MQAMEIEILKRASAYFARENVLPKWVRLVQELAVNGFDVAVTCGVLKVSRSGYYEWRGRAPSARAVADAALSTTIAAVHEAWHRDCSPPSQHRTNGSARS